MKNKLNILILIPFLFLGTSSLSQNDLTSYLELAAQNNPELKYRFNLYMAAMEEIPQVGALPDPEVAFGYFIQPVETRIGPQNASVSVNQKFPWFGTLKAKENAATKKAKIKQQAFKEFKSKLFYRVKSTYYELYFINKAISTTKENIDILKTLKELSLSDIQVDKGSVVNKIRVEMEIRDLKNQLADLNDRLSVHKTHFKNLLNESEDFEVNIESTLEEKDLPFDIKILTDSIMQHNHQIKKAEKRIKYFEQKKEVASKKGKPSFNIGIDYRFTGKRNDYNGSDNGQNAIIAKVGVKLPLYRKKYKAMVKEANLMKKASDQKKESKKDRIE
ncbi:MAG: TolC family protein, partial [Flavobacteriales bacterium]